MNTEQILSDQKFHTKHLQTKAAEILGLDPENTSWVEIVGTLEKAFTDYTANLKDATQRLRDYEEERWDVLKLTNELDEAINGHGKAERPRLCDIVAQIKSPLFVCMKMPPGLDHLNRTLVADTAEKMAVKLRAAEIKYGYGASWLENNWEAKCRSDLMFHIDKGDPTDVAIYSAFMMHHGWSTRPKLVGR